MKTLFRRLSRTRLPKTAAGRDIALPDVLPRSLYALFAVQAEAQRPLPTAHFLTTREGHPLDFARPTP